MTRFLPEKKATVNLLTIFAAVTFGLQVLTLFFLFFQGLAIHNLSNRKPPNFVQIFEGAGSTNNTEHEPEMISQFVSQTMAAMFDWAGTLPANTIEDATNPKPDTGVSILTSIGATKKVPTTSWIASFALSEDFRQGFLTQIAEMIPVDLFTKNTNQEITTRLVIQRVYPPQKIATNRWRVGLVANIVQLRRADNKKVLIPFNKDFLVRSVDAFEHPLENTNQITELQKTVYKLRERKLEIYEVNNLCLTDAYDNINSQSNRCGMLNSNSFTQ
ncbi:MAG: hypothetical protein IGS39_02310 [Calothrix sp. C42_A2020_038]|nr:hypothetical protein [Calothrix sp. C42_A2020_038]